MLDKLIHTVPTFLLEKALLEIKNDEFRTTLNIPTGDFFYDKWILHDQYRDTIWENILSTLPIDIGEARIIILNSGTCYHSHSDIDNRYHLNISGNRSYLIDLDSNSMYPTVMDGIWYEMNTNLRHVAANFGSNDRIQLVVRKLLQRNKLKNPIRISIVSNIISEKLRFIFDDTISPWLNVANKRGIIHNFSTDFKEKVFLDIENEYIDELINLVPVEFKVEIMK